MSISLKYSVKAPLARAAGNIGKGALLAALFVGGGLSVRQAQAADATANGTATVMTPISIAKTADLRFGKLSALTGGTVVVSAAGARSATGAVVLSSTDAGGAASFSVSGDANATYAVTLPGSATITHTVDNTKTMSIGSFTSNPSGTGTLSGGGSQTLAVGGTLTVGNAQTTGSYTGTFSVTVEYN